LNATGYGMERVIISKDGVEEEVIPLDAAQLAIGRDPKLEITLSDPSVSRRHARLVRIFRDFFIEDLGSTNGTFLNEHAVGKHILKHGDLLRIGSYTLRYLAQDEVVDDLDKTVVLPPSVSRARPVAATGGVRQRRSKCAVLHFFRGEKKGRRERMERALYPIGRPGGVVAAIARRPQGYFLLHIGGDPHPRINDQEISRSGGVLLHEGDLVEVGENLLEIHFDT